MGYLLSLSLLLALATPARGAEIVTSCGQLIDGSKAILGADLDCAPLSGVALEIRDSGSVNLAGFTISGGTTGIRAQGRCKVFSDPPGGTITGQETDAIVCGNGFAQRGGAKITDVTVTDGGSPGAAAIEADGRIRLKRVTVRNWSAGVRSVGATSNGVKVSDSVIEGNGGDGVKSGATMNVKNSIITSNAGDGLRAGIDSSLTVRDSVVSGNGSGGVVNYYARATVKDCDVIGNGGTGVTGFPVRVSNSTVSDNGLNGLDGRGVTLRKSTATGNGTSPDCGVAIGCADLVTSSKAPGVLATSVCDTSYVRDSGIPGTTWGVCTLD